MQQNDQDIRKELGIRDIFRVAMKQMIIVLSK